MIMPEETIPEKDKQIEEIPETAPETGEESAWSRDQREKSYYYDDSWGYQVYDPDEDEEKPEVEKKK